MVGGGESRLGIGVGRRRRRASGGALSGRGRRGHQCPPPGSSRALPNWPRSLGALLIVDEVQSGYGRTGSMFAIDQTTVVPDIVVLGKAMGNGMPIGASTTTDSVSQRPLRSALEHLRRQHRRVCGRARRARCVRVRRRARARHVALSEDDVVCDVRPR